jgi:hypothetical protein
MESGGVRSPAEFPEVFEVWQKPVVGEIPERKLKVKAYHCRTR